MKKTWKICWIFHNEQFNDMSNYPIKNSNKHSGSHFHGSEGYMSWRIRCEFYGLLQEIPHLKFATCLAVAVLQTTHNRHIVIRTWTAMTMEQLSSNLHTGQHLLKPVWHNNNCSCRRDYVPITILPTQHLRTFSENMVSSGESSLTTKWFISSGIIIRAKRFNKFICYNNRNSTKPAGPPCTHNGTYAKYTVRNVCLKIRNDPLPVVFYCWCKRKHVWWQEFQWVSMI